MGDFRLRVEGMQSAVNNAEVCGIPWLSGRRKYSRLQGYCPERSKTLQIGGPVEAAAAA
jgi:hypothetical protein